MANTAGPLSAASLARLMAASLPRSATPQLKTPYEAVALAVHACMLAVGFRLLGLGEDHNLENNDSQSSASQVSQLPDVWNASSSIAFRYAHDQSAMQFIVKISRLGSSATVDAVALGHDRRTSFDIKVQDYISTSALPATPISTDTSSDSQPAPKALTDIFISEHRLSDLGLLVRDHIIQKLVPGLQKEGYEEFSSSSSNTASASGQARDAPQPSRQPLRNPYDIPDALREPGRFPRPPPRIPAPGEEPPGFEDEYDILRAPGRGGPGSGRFPASPFGNVGHDDLYPPSLGPRDPLSGGPGGIGRQPQGMHPTPDEILGQAGGIGGGGESYGPEGGLRGGMRVPPGARYDPTHPGDPFDPLRRPGGGSGSGGFGGGFGGGSSGFFGGGGGGII